MPPTPAQVVIGILAVLGGCLAVTASAYVARRTGNWLYYLCTLGSFAFVLGVVAQRVFPSPAAVARLGAAAASTSVPGPWDAGVTLPLIAIRVTPVAIVGLLIAAVGLSLVLLFERVPGTARTAVPTRASRLEDNDSV
ncbi:MAG: hypothetical protein ACYDCS_10650 [Candidatus Dormibacteria bacterium]